MFQLILWFPYRNALYQGGNAFVPCEKSHWRCPSPKKKTPCCPLPLLKTASGLHLDSRMHVSQKNIYWRFYVEIFQCPLIRSFLIGKGPGKVKLWIEINILVFPAPFFNSFGSSTSNLHHHGRQHRNLCNQHHRLSDSIWRPGRVPTCLRWGHHPRHVQLAVRDCPTTSRSLNKIPVSSDQCHR